MDLLLAPYENINEPNGGELYLAGEQVVIQWETAHDIIDQVDIYFSKDGGQNYSLIESGIPNTGQYEWVPAETDVTQAGMIQIVYHNTLSSNTCDDTSDGLFAIALPSAARYDNRSGETLLDYAGTPYTSVTFDYDVDNLKDLMISIKDASSYLYRSYDITINGVPVFDDMTQNVFPEGQRPQRGLRGLAVADYDNDGYIDIFAADEEGGPDGYNARLYHNEGPPDYNFTDQATATGLVPYTINSWVGAWGDYDGDGQVDLFIAGAVGDDVDPYLDMPATNFFLLKNKVADTGTFEDVSESALGIDPYYPEQASSCAASWGDVDLDQDLDLLIADIRDFSGTGATSSKFYVNNGDGTFSNGNPRLPKRPKIQGSTGAAWVDFDNDSDLDLVLSEVSNYYYPWIFYNNGNGYFNDDEPVGFEEIGGKTIGVRPYDHDLDGRQDLLFMPQADTDHPWLYANKAAVGGPYFLDETVTVGLDDIGRVDGAVAADYNADGDIDLYLGRQVATSKFYYRATKDDGTDPPEYHWVGLRLLPSDPPINNAACLGATATFSVPGIFQQTQIVDGGSGRGGQSDKTLICGLGELTGSVQTEIRWPNGHTQSETLTPDAINDVYDTTVPEIDDNSVSGTYTAKPNGKVDWEFYWETKWNSKAALDKVIIESAGLPPACELERYVLDPSVPDVQHSLIRSGDVYKHELIWLDRDCIPRCTYNFKVESATDQAMDDSDGHQLRIRFCPSQ